jgi:uncharacterized membrane protein
MSDEALAIVLIVALGLATYATRIGGHLILSRFERIDPRVEAALDAVPAAVLTGIVAPAALAAGPAEALAALITVIAALRFSILATLAAGVAVVVALRLAGL